MARMTPEALVERLVSTFGDSLRAVVLYGSAVAGEHIAHRSDYNVLLIADDLPLDVLRAAGSATRGWTDDGNPPPLMFTSEEWRGSADVFPMEYADILERHRVLYGALPVGDVAVARDHLRLQVEQDARGKLLHLRQAFVGAGSDNSTHLAVLEHTLSKLMVLYRALLRLAGESRPTDYEELTRAAARVAGFDADAVLTVVRHVRGSQRVPEREASAVAAAYLEALEQLGRHLESLQ
ncbi:MAG TPA: hypothetical protein VMM17_04935 [Gemmatimonadaceae bacterium]|nr:hypothetical protein [Gemmatimonadaceae bacterium]